MRGSGCVGGNDFVRVTIGLNGVYSYWESEEKLYYVMPCSKKRFGNGTITGDTEWRGGLG